MATIAGRVLQIANITGRSCHKLPVRMSHRTASRRRRLSPPLRPMSLGLPRQCSFIFIHLVSASTKRSIQSLKSHSTFSLKRHEPEALSQSCSHSSVATVPTGKPSMSLYVVAAARCGNASTIRSCVGSRSEDGHGAERCHQASLFDQRGAHSKDDASSR